MVVLCGLMSVCISVETRHVVTLYGYNLLYISYTLIKLIFESVGKIEIRENKIHIIKKKTINIILTLNIL